MTAPSVDSAWRAALRRILHQSHYEPAPRGMRVRERVLDRIDVDMTRPVLTVPGRRLGYRFLPAEAAWILSGDDRVETIAPYSRAVSRFSDDGETFFGAYGTKIVPQLPYVVETLRRDPDSRQAVINIWREAPPPSRDVPCTLSTQFLVREGWLEQIVTMRSSDAWLGVPYDVFNFSMLAGVVLLELDWRDLRLGTLRHVAGSRHLYERNFDGARACVHDGGRLFRHAPFDPFAFATAEDLVAHLWALARRDRSDLRGPWLRELFDYDETKKKET